MEIISNSCIYSRIFKIFCREKHEKKKERKREYNKVKRQVKMAKSERRSKWKRKFRAIKRERNSVKELNTLKKVLDSGKKAVESMMDIAKPIEKNESGLVII